MAYDIDQFPDHLRRLLEEVGVFDSVLPKLKAAVATDPHLKLDRHALDKLLRELIVAAWHERGLSEEELARRLMADPRCAPLFDGTALEKDPEAAARLASPIGKAVLGFLQRTVADLGSERVNEFVRPTMSIPLRDYVCLDHLAVENMESPGFGLKAERACKQIAHFGETVYAKQVRALLGIARSVAGNAKPLPTTVGAIVGQAADLWGAGNAPVAPELLSVVDPLGRDVAFIRNSEDHKATQIDLGQRTIIFINTTKAGTEKRRGPLSLAQVEEIEDRLMEMSSILNICFAKVPMMQERDDSGNP